MKNKNSALRRIKLVLASFVFIISCAYIKNNKKNHSFALVNDSSKSNENQLESSNLGLDNTIYQPEYIGEPVGENIYFDSAIFIKKELNPFSKSFDGIHVKDFKDFINHQIAPGDEINLAKTDSNFVKFFIQKYKEDVDCDRIQINTIKTIIDHLEGNYLFYQKRFEGEVSIEEILHNSYDYELLGNEARKVTYTMEIPRELRVSLEQAEVYWLNGDTIIFNTHFKKTFTEFLYLFNSPEISEELKRNMVIVFGYFSFVRYVNYPVTDEINRIFLPRSGPTDITKSFSPANWHTMYHVLAKYNVNSFINSLAKYKTKSYHFLEYSNMFYARAIQMEMYQCHFGTYQRCNAKKEMVKVLMYNDNDLELRQKALSLVTSYTQSGRDYNDWLILRALFSLQFSYSYDLAQNQDSVRKYEIIASNSILNTYSDLSDVNLYHIYSTVAQIMNENKVDSAALYYNYLAYKLLLNIDFNNIYADNYGGVVQHIPFYLYKIGRKKEALTLFEYLENKKFTEIYFYDNLQNRFTLFIGDGEYTKAQKINKRILDSATKLNDPTLYEQAFLNKGILANAKGHNIISKVMYSIANDYQKLDKGNPYLVGRVNTNDAMYQTIQLADSVASLGAEINKNKLVISKQRENISTLNAQTLRLNNFLILQSSKLKAQNDSLKNKEVRLEKVELEIKEKKAENTIIEAQNRSLNLDNDDLKNERKNLQNDIILVTDKLNTSYVMIALAIFSLILMSIVAFLVYKQKREAVKQKLIVEDQKIKLTESEARHRILSQTMNQLGHLAPDIQLALATKIKDLNKEVYEKMNTLGTRLRQLYKQSVQSSSTLNTELELTKAFMNIRYADDHPQPTDLIKIKHPDISNLHVPPLIFFNLIVNAFKHGQIAERDEEDNYGTLQIDAVEDMDFWQISLENDCPPPPPDFAERNGTGLQFVQSILKKWNGNSVPDFLEFKFQQFKDRWKYNVAFNLKKS